MSSDEQEQGAPASRPAPGRRRPRAATSVLVGATLLSALGGVVALGAGGDLGRLRVATVADASTSPALDAGDLVVVRLVPAEALRRGDLVTSVDAEQSRLVTHRVQDVVRRGDVVRVAVGGDAGGAGERGSVARDGEVARVAVSVPEVGRVVGVLGTPVGRASASSAVLVLGLGAAALVRRPRREDVTALLVEQLELLRLTDADDAAAEPAPSGGPTLASAEIDADPDRRPDAALVLAR